MGSTWIFLDLLVCLVKCFLILLGQAWILPLKEDMMCVLIVSFGKVKQSETFVYYKTIRTPLFPFWICDSEKRWEKGVYFLNFLVFGRKDHPFFGWKHLYFHRSSRSNFEGQKPSPLHHRWCTSCQEYRTLTSEVEDQGRMEMAYMFGMYAVDTST